MGKVEKDALAGRVASHRIHAAPSLDMLDCVVSLLTTTWRQGLTTGDYRFCLSSPRRPLPWRVRLLLFLPAISTDEAVHTKKSSSGTPWRQSGLTLGTRVDKICMLVERTQAGGKLEPS